MNTMYSESEKQALIGEMKVLYKKFQEYSVRVEDFKERNSVVQELHRLCVVGSRIMDIHCPELLVALLDVYEVVRDEHLLQKVLDIVSQNLLQLEPSWINVRLLTFCYYYTEDEECSALVKKMIPILAEAAGGEQDQTYDERLRECRELIPGLGF